jgi:hypothetical protein
MMQALITPMLSGKTTFVATGPAFIHDVDAASKHLELVGRFGQPDRAWSQAHWLRWNDARNANIRAWLSKQEGKPGLLMVHDRNTAGELRLPTFGFVVIPDDEFERRAAANPNRANLARMNRTAVLGDIDTLRKLKAVPYVYRSIATAARAYREEQAPVR